MAEAKVQSFQNHAKFDPPFHFFMAPVALVTVVVASNRLWERQSFADVWFFVLSLALLVAFFKIRIYSLKVQDRVIRLEEQLRMQRVLPPALQFRIPELTVSQLVALRFASDAELPALVEKTLANGWGNKDIKKNIVNWRPDFFRV